MKYIIIFLLLCSVCYAQHNYIYPIKINRVLDGDTLDCDIDMGLDIIVKGQKIRLYGCDAYEKSYPILGEKATNFTKNFVSTGTLTLETTGKRDSFGRILGIIRNKKGISLSDELTSNGLTTGRFAL